MVPGAAVGPHRDARAGRHHRVGPALRLRLPVHAVIAGAGRALHDRLGHDPRRVPGDAGAGRGALRQLPADGGRRRRRRRRGE